MDWTTVITAALSALGGGGQWAAGKAQDVIWDYYE